jgi:hypothetical protein
LLARVGGEELDEGIPLLRLRELRLHRLEKIAAWTEHALFGTEVIESRIVRFLHLVILGHYCTRRTVAYIPGDWRL